MSNGIQESFCMIGLKRSKKIKILPSTNRNTYAPTKALPTFSFEESNDPAFLGFL